ncbi:MAG TPA: hypothetical protein GXX20_01510 [Clostridiaceae bacterium]|nr:hypothetical protein [Clostridiaceae bacterium]
MLRIRNSIPFFTECCIPENFYMHQKTAIPTLGIGNFAICHRELADNMAYDIVKTVFDHIKTQQLK